MNTAHCHHALAALTTDNTHTNARGAGRLAAAVTLVAAIAVGTAACRTENAMHSRHGKYITWKASPDGLDKELLRALARVATRYHQKTGASIVITSARRTLQHQARLMAAMNRTQLEGMYCRNGYPSYIRDLVAKREIQGSLSEREAYRILVNRTEGYISSHLYGAAVDISPNGMDTDLIRKLLTQEGFRTLDERNLGVACIHATYQAVPVRMVRE